MDKTKEVFKEYFDYKKRLEAQKHLPEAVRSAIDEDEKLTDTELLKIAERNMEQAMWLHEYNVALADVCKNLDIDITYFTDKKRGYMDAIDHIVAPRGAGSYFKRAREFPFWQRRLLKWKKIFVQRDSIIQFLTENMYITYTDNCIEKEALIDVNIANYLIDNNVLYRRCNIKELVLKRKRDEFVRKTLIDIAMYKKSMIGPCGLSPEVEEECEKEIAMVKRLDFKDLALTANNKEVSDFIANNEHQKLFMRGDKEVILYMFLDTREQIL